MVALVLCPVPRNDPGSPAWLPQPLKFGSAKASDLADASAGEERKPQCEADGSRTWRLDDVAPKQSNLGVGKNAPADILDPSLFQPMARIGLDKRRVHTKSENRTHERLYSIRQRGLARRHQPLD